MDGRWFCECIRLAHGLEMPAMGCLLVEESAQRLHIDCWMIDWDLVVRLPMPRGLALAYLEATAPIDATDEEVLERVARYRVFRPSHLTVFCYALARFDAQPAPVREHLRRRFGLEFEACRRFAEREWASAEAFGYDAWLGGGPQPGI